MAKMTRKELLNAPDEFVTTTSTAVKWIKENPARFASITTIIIVIIISGIGFYYWKTNRDINSMLAYSNAYNNSGLTLQVMQEYADTKAGKLSQLRLARLAYEQKDFPMAVNYTDDFINSWSHEDIFFWEGMLIMASAYMEQDKKDKALALLDQCTDKAPEHIRDQALFFRAQVLIGLERNDEAKESLKEISDNYQDIAQITLANLEK